MSFQVNGETFRPSGVPVVIEPSMLSAKGVAITRENEEDLVGGDGPLRVEVVAHAAREEEDVVPSSEASADARILNVRLFRAVCAR